LPKTDPSRPAGRERNIVVTEWDWNTPQAYLHDEISTDRRNPTVNAHGIIYGSPEESSDFIPWLDPVDNKSGLIKSEYRDPKTPTTKNDPIFNESPYWGTEQIWDSHTSIHNPMLDDKGRLWVTARIRPGQQSRVLQGRLEASLGGGVPAWALRTAGGAVRSQDAEDHHDRSLLQHAPSAVRQQGRAVVQRQRRQSGGRLVRREQIRSDA
jgi:hypothetical protein